MNAVARGASCLMELLCFFCNHDYVGRAITIVAIKGDRVCTAGNRYVINGQLISRTDRVLAISHPLLEQLAERARLVVTLLRDPNPAGSDVGDLQRSEPFGGQHGPPM